MRYAFNSPCCAVLCCAVLCCAVQDLDLHCNFGLGDCSEPEVSLQPLAHLSALTGLNLGGCGMQRLPPGLRLPALRALALWSNRLAEGGEPALDCLTSMHRLTSLSLSANGLRELPGQVTALSALASLSMSRNRDAKRAWVLDLDLLPSLPALTHLDLAGCDLRFWPLELPKLKSLQVGLVVMVGVGGGWLAGASTRLLLCQWLVRNA